MNDIINLAICLFGGCFIASICLFIRGFISGQIKEVKKYLINVYYCMSLLFVFIVVAITTAPYHEKIGEWLVIIVVVLAIGLWWILKMLLIGFVIIVAGNAVGEIIDKPARQRQEILDELRRSNNKRNDEME